MKKYIVVLFLVTFIVPSIALASWWNPFSWKVFHKVVEQKVEQTIIPEINEVDKVIPTIETETSKVDQSIEIEKLKKEVEVLKKNTDSVISTSKTITTIPLTNNSGSSNEVKKEQKPTVTASPEVVKYLKIICIYYDYYDGTIDPTIVKNCSNQTEGAIFNSSSEEAKNVVIKLGKSAEKVIVSGKDYNDTGRKRYAEYILAVDSPLILPPPKIETRVQERSTTNNYVSNFNCSNYQSEKNEIDNRHAQNGTVFSGARNSEMADLEAKYDSCF